MRRLDKHWSIGVSDSLLTPGWVSAVKRFILAAFIAIPVFLGWLEI